MKREQLQRQIIQQQDELRHVSELLIAQCGFLPDRVPSQQTDATRDDEPPVVTRLS